MRPSDGMTAEEARIALAADVARRKPLETPQRSRACDLPRDSRGRFQRRVNRLDGDVEGLPADERANPEFETSITVEEWRRFNRAWIGGLERATSPAIAHQACAPRVMRFTPDEVAEIYQGHEEGRPQTPYDPSLTTPDHPTHRPTCPAPRPTFWQRIRRWLRGSK